MKLRAKEVEDLLAIGLCVPSYYQPAVWRKAKKFMDQVVCPAELAHPHNYGRGKGKYKLAAHITLKEASKVVKQILKNQGDLLSDSSELAEAA